MRLARVCGGGDDGSGGDVVVIIVVVRARGLRSSEHCSEAALARARHRRHCRRRSASGNRGTCSIARHSAFSHSRRFRTKDIASARRGHKLPELPGLSDRSGDLSRSPRGPDSTARARFADTAGQTTALLY